MTENTSSFQYKLTCYNISFLLCTKMLFNLLTTAEIILLNEISDRSICENTKQKTLKHINNILRLFTHLFLICFLSSSLLNCWTAGERDRLACFMSCAVNAGWLVEGEPTGDFTGLNFSPVACTQTKNFQLSNKGRFHWRCVYNYFLK